MSRAAATESFGTGISAPAVLIVQSDAFNQSIIRTVIVAVITSNLRLAAPGNVMLRKRESRLAKDSIVNISQLLTLSKDFLADRVARIPPARIREVESGLRLVLSL